MTDGAAVEELEREGVVEERFLGVVGDAVEGEKLVVLGRRTCKPIIISATAWHGAQQVYIDGNPARCYVDRPVRIPKR